MVLGSFTKVCCNFSKRSLYYIQASDNVNVEAIMMAQKVIEGALRDAPSSVSEKIASTGLQVAILGSKQQAGMLPPFVWCKGVQGAPVFGKARQVAATPLIPVLAVGKLVELFVLGVCILQLFIC